MRARGLAATAAAVILALGLVGGVPRLAAGDSAETAQGPAAVDRDDGEAASGSEAAAPPARDSSAKRQGAGGAAGKRQAGAGAPSVERKVGELVNGSFEQGLAGWQIAGGGKGSVEVDGSAAKGGKRCLRLSARRSGINPAVAQRVELPRRPGWLRVGLFVRPTLLGRARVVVRLELLGDHDNILRRYFLQDINADPKAWRRLEGRVPLTGREAAARMTVRLVGTGGVWIDEVRAQLAPGMVVLPRRLAVVEGRQGRATLMIFGADGGKVRAELDGRRVAARLKDGQCRVTLPALKAGRHRLALTVGRARDEVAVWCTPVDRKPRMLTDDGWWQVRGRRQALVVLMHASPQDAADAAERAFNAIEILPPSGREAIKGLLKGLARDGPGLVVPFDLRPPGPERERYVKSSLEAIAEAAADRRVVAWLVADEPDVRLEPLGAPEAYLRAKKADGLHPMLVTLGGPYDAEFWQKFADGLVVNVCSLARRPEAIARRLADVRRRLEPWQPLGAVLPAGWTPSGPQPDAAQARLNAFAAAAAGCRVFAWYCLRATGWDLRAAPLWAGLRDINEDLRRLVEAVAGLPRAADVQVSGAPVSAAWGSGQRRVVLLVNTTAGDTKAEISLAGAVGRVGAMVGRATPVVAGRKVIVALGPQKVVALRLELAGPSGKGQGAGQQNQSAAGKQDKARQR